MNDEAREIGIHLPPFLRPGDLVLVDLSKHQTPRGPGWTRHREYTDEDGELRVQWYRRVEAGEGGA